MAYLPQFPINETHRTLVVSQQGEGDYSTIAEALAKAVALTPSATNPIVIEVRLGTYAEANPLTVPAYVSIQGNGAGRDDVVVTPVTTTTWLFELAGASSSLKWLKIKNASGVGGIGVKISDKGDLWFSTVQDCETGILVTGASAIPALTDCTVLRGFAGAVTTGIKVEAGASAHLFNPRLIAVNPAAKMGTGILVTGTGSVVFIDGGLLQYCSNGGIANNAGKLRAVSCLFDTCDRAVRVDESGTGSSRVDLAGCTIDDSVNYDLEVNTATSVLHGTGLTARQDLCVFNPSAEVSVAFMSQEPDNQAFTSIADLTVGRKTRGRAAHFGTGASYTNNMLVYTYRQATGVYTDVSAAARDLTTEFTFPDGLVNDAIYVSSNNQDGLSAFLQFYDLRCLLKTVMSVDGVLEKEYWNGSTWTAFTVMETGQLLPYAPQGTTIFKSELTCRVRFNWKIQSDWALNDPPTLGTNRYWMRFRISTQPTTKPVFYQFRLGPSRTRMAEDGFLEYFGNARPMKRLALDVNLFKPAAASPTAQDLYLSKVLDAGRDENSFDNGAINRTAFASFLPFEIDTGCPLRIVLSWVVNTNNTGNVDWTVRWALSDIDSLEYPTLGTAPASAPGQRSLDKIVTVPLNNLNKQINTTIDLDISNFISRAPGQPAGKVLWVSIERDATAGNLNDTLVGNAAVLQLLPLYAAWCEGGHILGQL
jgi:hypothetical protein